MNARASLLAAADPLPEPVACSQRWAQKFMEIAKNRVLPKAKHTSLLPPSIETLSDLSKLPDDKLEIALSEGWVSPRTQRRDVKEIRERLVEEAAR